MVRQLVQLPERRKAVDCKKLPVRTKPKGKRIEVISLEGELEEFRLSKGDGYMWMRRLKITQD